MSQSNIERIVLYIDSAHRTTGTVQNFSITLASSISKVTEVEVIGAEIPYTFYAINSANNTICWSTAGTDYSAVVPTGNYGVTSFIIALKTAMNLVMSGFDITYIKEKYQLLFTNSTAFSLVLSNTAGTSTIAEHIGVTVATSLSTSVVPIGVINIGGPRYLLIKSSRLTRPKITRPFLNDSQADVLYKMQIAGSPGDILIEKNGYTNLMKYGVRQTLQTIDFQLTDDKNVPIDLNGQNWSLTVNLVTS